MKDELSSSTLRDVPDPLQNMPFNIKSFMSAKKKLFTQILEFEDENHIIENLIEVIDKNILPLNSINFKKICTQIRIFLDPKKINYISPKGQKIIFSFNEKDICIGPSEYEFYSRFLNNEDAIRAILGVDDMKTQEYPNKNLVFDGGEHEPSLDDMRRGEIDSLFMSNSSLFKINDREDGENSEEA